MDLFSIPKYTLQDILAVAAIHPFYNSHVRFPPTDPQIKEAIRNVREKGCPALTSLPLTHKDNLYQTIQRLIADNDPDNVFRHACYISTTGGGSGGLPMFYLTDTWENRIQRMSMGKLIRQGGLIVPGDCVLTVHTSGNLYRSLDLTAEILENAGGTVYCAGHLMPHAEVMRLVSGFRINVISGDSSQILQFALHVSTLPDSERKSIHINKIFYTSEPLVRSQRAFINSVFGGDVLIYSMFGSAESGPWAVMNPAVTGYREDDDAADFIFDTRDTIVEVLPRTVGEGSAGDGIEPLRDGELGVLATTSLQRLRNPLIRYLTGDVGSLHPLPKTNLIDPEEAQHFKVLRMQGRDKRFSFEWQGEYYDFKVIRDLIQSDEFSVLQWQIIRSETSIHTHNLQIRLLQGQYNDRRLSDDVLVWKLKKFFNVVPDIEGYFQVTFVSGLQEFERSKTGNKVMHYLDFKS
ncbi:uncharacterized protein ASPGLDRAFT_84992 [Aspergillus glaucus CBS 516.65]|uniref:AMP-dependent synthetase/ligase domain-containing protein n=1 Tax=Aspergillus glaucus CBS 516.65 TaxID=1160497 RepID=A0A1L9V982_ASPGL|nr:hypothetical protein ASPGLDRAFT_84992 [Aspergillus glaucus CBS 516.65]OJJ80487.1 hypothetical protein ASPGLDRAFT_84992 [Aspergillus glaucus CBS 516.65]